MLELSSYFTGRFCPADHCLSRTYRAVNSRRVPVEIASGLIVAAAMIGISRLAIATVVFKAAAREINQIT